MIDELLNLTGICKKCGYEWVVQRSVKVRLPYSKRLKCPECGFEYNETWYDDETNKKLTQKALGLLPSENKDDSQIISKSIEALEAKFNSLSKEVELLRTKLDLLTKDEIQKLKNEDSDHTFTINGIQTRMNDLEKEFQEIKNWKNQQNGRQPPTP